MESKNIFIKPVANGYIVTTDFSPGMATVALPEHVFETFNSLVEWMRGNLPQFAKAVQPVNS